MDAPLTSKTNNVPDFLSGGGHMGAYMRAFDWEKTPLGPPDAWPHSLKTCVRIMLTSRQPMFVWWGKDLINIYNDAYMEILGDKHPALSKSGNIVWQEIWDNVGPRAEKVLQQNEGTYDDALLLIMNRYGYDEETYFKFSYNPVPGDKGGTEGLFCACTEETENVINERQINTVKELNKISAGSKEMEVVYQETIEALHANPQDIPFAVIYEIDAPRRLALYKAATTADENVLKSFCGHQSLKGDHVMSQKIAAAFETGRQQVLHEVAAFTTGLPAGAWSQPPGKIVFLPVKIIGSNEPFAVVVVGLNPYRQYNKKYVDFLNLAADSIGAAISNARIIEEERRRARALAELDNAKTIFFSNISHEFRTPLTLMLSPLEEVMRSDQLPDDQAENVRVAYRNTLRLQKLVNTLLDFSKLEAGRMQQHFQAVDLSALTKDLVSTFRSAIEKAGLQLEVDCPELPQPVDVDVDMWEKIVLNLVSNALKYTTQGTIRVQLMEEGDGVILSVQDTGIGIPDAEKERIFERFHRIENTVGRSQEGTGIGLSLTKELVKLHQGQIIVDSREGQGSVFKVVIPVKQQATRTGTVPVKENNQSPLTSIFADEAEGWLQNDIEESGRLKSTNEKSSVPLVLLVDDNADMRNYISRLMSRQYRVVSVTDGDEAMSFALQHTPELILCDIMMPRLNGLDFARQLRGLAATKNIPLIFLSGRAGEEARLEGLKAGADDYLVKPFSARELVAKVETAINIRRTRGQAEQYLYSLIMQAPVAMCVFKGPDFVVEVANEKVLDLWGKSAEQVLNKPVFEGMPDARGQGYEELLENVYHKGQPFHAHEMAITLERKGVPELVFLNFTHQPLYSADGTITGVVSVAVDVTEQVKVRKKIEENEKELNEMANAMPQLVWVAENDGSVIFYNDRVIEFAGAEKDASGRWRWQNMVHPDDAEKTVQAWSKAVENGTNYSVEHRVKMANGLYRWHLSRGYPQKNEAHQVVKWFGTATDIHEQKMTEENLEALVLERTEALQRSNEDLEQFAHVASHDLKEPVRKIKTFSSRLMMEYGNTLHERGKMYIEKIENAATRMYMMIDGILAYSSFHAFEQQWETISLEQVIQNIEADLEMVFQQKGAKVDYENLPRMEGYAVLINQLFYNLINNALKFARPDVPPLIHISSDIVQKKSNAGATERRFVEIRVSDNGIGFEPAEAETIFKTFTRLNAKDKYEGTGLGLSLCKKIVERHGGSISATGKAGVGATFTILLPLTQQQV